MFSRKKQFIRREGEEVNGGSSSGGKKVVLGGWKRVFVNNQFG
jgi:hypothetical protein